jgi:hypothetical protein
LDGTLDPVVMFLSVSSVLALSIYTISRCRTGSGALPSTLAELLFRGLGPIYAIAGNLSAIFSITYFSGALFIYGHIFGAWCLLVLALVGILLIALISRTLRAVREEGLAAELQGNLLLALLQRRLTPRGFKRLCQVYVLIYAGLLIEELGVARLVLANLFPRNPVPAALLLTTVCAVVLVYLSYGGLRAALIADFEQLKVLLLFLGVLVFYLAHDFNAGEVTFQLTVPLTPGFFLLGILASVLLLVAWFGSAVDFYARLRFESHLSDSSSATLRVARTSVGLVLLLMAAGVTFGQHLTRIIPDVLSPSQFTAAVLSYFRSEGSPILLAILLTAAFCMVFTTLNALLIALLHLGWHRRSRWLTRRQLGLVLLVGLFFSTGLKADAVSAYGVFVASLMILPLSSILRVLFGGSHVDGDEGHLIPALTLSVVVFGISYSALETEFTFHFLLPTIVGVVCGSTLLASSLVQHVLARRPRRADE